MKAIQFTDWAVLNFQMLIGGFDGIVWIDTYSIIGGINKELTTEALFYFWDNNINLENQG